MQELQVMIERKPGELIWTNYGQIEEELDRIIGEYKGLVYTEADIPDAKKDRASLNKLKNDIETARKELKKAWMAPYTAIEEKAKALTGMIDAQISEIDASLKDYEEQRKAAARKAVMDYIEESIYCFPETVRERIADAIYDPKWTNKTAKAAEWKKAINGSVERIRTEVTLLRGRGLSEAETDAVLKAYARNFSLTEAIQKADELKAQRDAIAIEMARDAIKADDVAAVKVDDDPLKDFMAQMASLGEEEEKRKVLCIWGKGDYMKDIQLQAEGMGLEVWYQMM